MQDGLEASEPLRFFAYPCWFIIDVAVLGLALVLQWELESRRLAHTGRSPETKERT
jgi:hypothetical protein